MGDRDVAIVGMAVVFPGICNLSEFWSRLINGVDNFDGRLSGVSEYHRNPFRLQHNNDKDPYPLLLDVVRTALGDAAISAEGGLGRRTALIVNGAPGQDLAGSLAGELGLHGVCRDVDAAPSDLLENLAWAVNALRDARCDAAVVAALNLFYNTSSTESAFTLSTSGIPRPFDARADGTVISEGAAAVVLRRRFDVQIDDGGCVYAFIRGIHAAEEGQASGVALKQIFEDTQTHPGSIGFLETAANGDPAGDVQEIAVVRQGFGPQTPDRVLQPLGALKALIGDTGAVAGLASVVKTALCLSNKLIPPALHSDQPSPAMADIPFYLNRRTRPWVHDRSLPPRRALLNARGSDGRFGHVVLEEISEQDPAARDIRTALNNDSELVVLSADSAGELAFKALTLKRFLEEKGPEAPLSDVAYTLSVQFNSTQSCRLAMICTDLDRLQEYLEMCATRLASNVVAFDDISDIYFTADADRRAGKTACVFPGLGFPGLIGPYAEHLFDLCLRFPEIRSVFDLIECRDNLPEDPAPTSHLFFPPSYLSEQENMQLHQRLASPRHADDMKLTHPAERNLSSFGVAVANWASWNLLRKLDVPVDMLFGQSHGELSALCAAGVLEFDQVIQMHWLLDFAPERYITQGGRMALVSASEEQLKPLLQRFSDVSIAVHISPNFLILGGEAGQLEALIPEVRASGNWTQPLPYPAIHTPRFSWVRQVLEPYLDQIALKPFHVPVYSGMIGDVYPQDPHALGQSMIANLDHPVQLWQTTRKMYQDGARIFIQVGGGATMHSQAKTNINAEDVVAVSMDVDYRPALTQLNHLCATLLTNGTTLNLAHLFRYRFVRPLELELVSNMETVFDESLAADGSTAQQFYTVQTDKVVTQSFQNGSDRTDEPRMPFIGNVLDYTPEQHIVVERFLDLKEDLFLEHHLFINAEGIKPPSACLPVLPMTLGMELMAEVAACLAPDCGLIGFEDIEAMRWIGLMDADSLAMRTSATLESRDEAAGIFQIHAAVYLAEQDAPAIQAKVLFSRHYHLGLNLNLSEPQNQRPYPLSANQIYAERHLFHGPLFQCISGDTVLAEHSVVGELVVLPKDKMFASTVQPELLTDPILLDGVGQLIGLWAIDKGVYVFPIGIRKIELYCPTPDVGTRVPVYIEIKQFGSKFLYADVEIQDGEGQVWMRIQGWGDWVFHWSKRAYDFRRHPTQYCASRKLVINAGSADAFAQEIHKIDLRDFELHAMARLYLHTDEMPTFDNLGKVPDRQLQWLLGRIAVKDAVRRWLVRDQDAQMLHPAVFIVENDRNGRPFVKNLPADQAPPKISISHSNERAVALACADAAGIDIERITHRDERFLESVTTARERELIANFVDGDPTNAWITRLWCAKEAAAKLMGMDNHATPQAFEAMRINADGLFEILQHQTGRSVSVNVIQDTDYIIAYCAQPPAAKESPAHKEDSI